MPAFQFESNMPIILLIIVIALVSLYFYLDLKKIKTQFEELDNKNNMVIKEIDNIHLQLHKFFSKMPKSIVPRKIIPKQPITPKQQGNIINNNKTMNNDNKTMNNDNKTEISTHDFNMLKKQPKNSNNIFGEVEDMLSDINNNDTEETEEILKSDNEIKLPELVSVVYESELNDEDSEVEDNSDNDSDNDSDNESNNNLNIEDLSDLSEEDSNKLDEYMKMSVKELKSKCIEMNLQHSGNKTTLAKRIVENL